MSTFKKTITNLPLLACTAIAACSVSQAKPGLVSYPYDFSSPLMPRSDYYEVSVGQGNNTQSLTVYMSQSSPKAKKKGRNQAIFGNTISWSQFSFAGEVTVRVSLKTDQEKVKYGDLKILPSRFAIEPRKINATTAEFTLTQAGQYSVEFETNSHKNGLLIFADPLETDIPDKNAAAVKLCAPCNKTDLKNLDNYHTVYFAPEKHTIMHWRPPSNIKNIYLAGGAVVQGAIQLNDKANSHTKIWGRGILDGNIFGLEKINMVEAKGSVDHIHVEGIIISQPSKFAVRLLGKNNDIHWVKTPGGWRFNNDGLVGYKNTHISNCFVWANDDAIKLYRDNQKVENIVFWHLTNGGIFQWAWNTNDSRNIVVKNIDVLHGEWPGDGRNQGVFNARGSKNKKGIKTQEQWVFENIKIETPVNVLFNLAPKVPHRITNVVFRNIDAQMNDGGINRIAGFNKATPLSDITFENLMINGQCINSNNAKTIGNFQMENVKNIRFIGDCSL